MRNSRKYFNTKIACKDKRKYLKGIYNDANGLVSDLEKLNSTVLSGKSFSIKADLSEHRCSFSIYSKTNSLQPVHLNFEEKNLKKNNMMLSKIKYLCYKSTDNMPYIEDSAYIFASRY